MQVIHCEQTQKDLILLSHVKRQKKTILAKSDLIDAIVFKPWGMEYLVNQDTKCSAWMLHINKFHGTSFHCHMKKSTVIYVLSGMLLLTTSQKKQLLMPGDVVYIDKKTFHMLGTHTENTCVLETESLSCKTDAVRIIDFWARVGEPYESKCKILNLTKNPP